VKAATFDVAEESKPVGFAVESDECLDAWSVVGSVVGSGPVVGEGVDDGSGSAVPVAVADGVAVAVAVGVAVAVAVGVAVALGVAVVEVPVEVEVLVCALTTTPGATSVEVDVAPGVPDVVVVADGSVVDCVDEPVVAGSGFGVPVEPVDVESVDELDDDVESVVSADATP